MRCVSRYDMWAKISMKGFKAMISFRDTVEQRTAVHILANGLDQTSPNEYVSALLRVYELCLCT